MRSSFTTRRSARTVTRATTRRRRSRELRRANGAAHRACVRRRPCGCRPCVRFGIPSDSKGPSPPAVRMPRALIRSRNARGSIARGQRDRRHRRREARKRRTLQRKSKLVDALAHPTRERRMSRVHRIQALLVDHAQRFGDLQHDCNGRRARCFGSRFLHRALHGGEVPVTPWQFGRGTRRPRAVTEHRPRRAGADIKHFCDAVTATSTPHSSNENGMPPIDETPSTSTSLSRDRARRCARPPRCRSRHRWTNRRTPARSLGLPDGRRARPRARSMSRRAPNASRRAARRRRTIRRDAPTSRRTCHCNTRDLVAGREEIADRRLERAATGRMDRQRGLRVPKTGRSSSSATASSRENSGVRWWIIGRGAGAEYTLRNPRRDRCHEEQGRRGPSEYDCVTRSRPSF